MGRIKIKLIITGISLAILLLLAGMSILINAPIKQRVTVEAGSRDLRQTDFYKNPELYGYLLENNIPLVNCKLVTDLSKIPLSTPGEYSVQFLVNGSTNTSILKVEDTENPIVLVKEVVIAEGEKCLEEDFVERIEDATKVEIEAEGLSSYKKKAGIYKINLSVTDLGGNVTKKETTLFVLDVKSKVRVELGTEDFPADKFLNAGHDGLKLEYKEGFDIKKKLKKTGRYKIPIKASVKNNEKDIVLRLIVEDTTPPVIHGTRDLTLYIGSPILYRSGVFITDNQKEDIAIQVDARDVNPKEEGIYTVTYKAEDRAGNKSEKKINVTVRKSENSHLPEVKKYVKEVLEEITDEGMTELEKLEKIFEFSANNIGYVGYSDKSDVVEAAYSGFRTKKGDCFTYYAVSEMLISGAGFETLRVTREGGKSYHVWNLVKYEGKWYHFDSCPLEGAGGFRAFMLGDSELAEFSESYGKRYPGHSGYYNFDESAYPERAEKGVK